MSAVLKPGTASTNEKPVSGEVDVKTDETIDGFHLVIEALKLNGIDTVFGLPGIPITDLTRKMQAEGLRVISFRHEQHAGNAAAAAGFLTGKPGICLTVSAPGFLNGLTALANATCVQRVTYFQLHGPDGILRENEPPTPLETLFAMRLERLAVPAFA